VRLAVSLGGRLDRRTGLPLYVQVAERVRALIASEGLHPGTALPSEAELQQRFDVSRATIRQALQRLELEGLVERQQGRGTFVAVPQLERALPELASFTEHLATQGLASSSRLLRYERVGKTGAGSPSPDPPDPALFPRRTPLVRVVRLRLANDVPVGLHTTLMAHEVAERIGFTEDRLRAEERLSLYASLEAAGRPPSVGEEHLQARSLAPDEARLLRVPRQTAAMSVLRLTRDAEGVLLEAVRAVYLGDRYDYVIPLQRAGSGQRR
jgi:GntR family transcriptional regulator